MSAAALVKREETKLLARYPITEEAIADLRAEYSSLTADTPEGYEAVRVAIGKCTKARVAVDKCRKDLKEEALRYGQAVDGAARALRVPLEEIEAGLQAKKDAVDAAKRKAQEAAERAALLAEEKRIKEAQAAEDARLSGERERQEKDRAVFAAAQAAADKKRAEEQAAIDAQRAELAARERAIADEKARLAREEDARQAAARAEQESKAKAEADARGAAEEAARMEALRPEIEKVRGWAAAFRELAAAPPAVTTDEACQAIEWAQGRLEFVAAALETFPKADS